MAGDGGAAAGGGEAPPAVRTGFRVPAGEARAELREKGSRFLAVIAPATDEAAARAVLERLQSEHPDASHHCHAWRVGAGASGRDLLERSSDAGEPSGTAGPPILQALRGAELQDVVAVVIRWFGGTKLGKGGLVRAYGGAARLALEELAVALRVPRRSVALEIPYDLLGAVMRLVHPPDVELARERYGEDTVTLALSVRQDRWPEVAAALADLGLADSLPGEEGRGSRNVIPT